MFGKRYKKKKRHIDNNGGGHDSFGMDPEFEENLLNLLAYSDDEDLDFSDNVDEDTFSKMQADIWNIMILINVPNNIFDVDKTYENISDYCSKYDRVAYSMVSNYVFAEHVAGRDPVGTVLSNISMLLSKTVDVDNYDEPDLKKKILQMLLKLEDHINLAKSQNLQIERLVSARQDELKRELLLNMQDEMSERSKSMTSQLLTLVGIFTALAFLIFGSIESLDNIFSAREVPVIRLMCIGIVWGLCILNMIFVFLFCVSKLTQNNTLASIDSADASIFQKYPVVFWSDFILIGLLAVFGWLYYVEQRGFGSWFESWIRSNEVLIVLGGFGVIAVAVFIFGKLLLRLTKNQSGGNQ